MKIWEFLDIPETTKILLIRKAYVEKLCAIKPEYFSIDGFLIMREAYLKALVYARTGEFYDYEIPEDGAPVIVSQDVLAYVNMIDRVRKLTLSKEKMKLLPITVSVRYNDIVRFFISMMALHDDFYSRIELDNWKNLFQAELLADIEVIEFLRTDVLKSCAANPLLPYSVWTYLDLVFHWSDNVLKPMHGCEKELKILSVEIDPRWDLNFNFFRMTEIQSAYENDKAAPVAIWDTDYSAVLKARRAVIKHPDFERYANLRRNVRNAIISDDSEAAEANFEMAVSVFDGDPDLYVIFFEYLKDATDNSLARMNKDLQLLVIDRLIEFYPDNFSFQVCRADIYSTQSSSAAILEFQKISERFPDSFWVLYRAAEEYIKIGEYQAAKVIIKGIEKNAASIQNRLSTIGGRSIAVSAAKEQYDLNEQVLKDIIQLKIRIKKKNVPQSEIKTKSQIDVKTKAKDVAKAKVTSEDKINAKIEPKDKVKSETKIKIRNEDKVKIKNEARESREFKKNKIKEEKEKRIKEKAKLKNEEPTIDPDGDIDDA